MGKKPVAAGKSSFDLIDRAKVISLLEVTSHAHCLDLACGIGNYSIEMAKHINEKGMIYAVDLWEEGIAALDIRIKEQNLGNIKTLVADISKPIPIGENSIDVCLMATIIHDLSKEDQQAAIREAGRLLKSSGMLNIIEFKKIDKGPGPPLHIRLREKEIESLVTSCGFTQLSCDDIGPFNYLARFKKTIA